MKIHFVDWGQGDGIFEITGIYYYTDEKGWPIDISIFGDKETLIEIGEFACTNYNEQPLDYPCNRMERDAFFNGAKHEALYARLPRFRIIEENGAWYW